MKIFGERVKALLKENGITQKKLAEKLNVQPSTLCEWLNGNNEPPMQVIVDIACHFKTTTDYLLGVTEYD